MRYYVALVGGCEVSFYARDDKRALRVVERWIRLVVPRYAARIRSRHPGSLADTMLDPAEVDLAWWPIDGGVVQLSRCTLVLADAPVAAALVAA